MKVFEVKSRKRKKRKEDTDSESSKKESPKKRKSESAVSGLKAKKNSLVEDLDQFQGNEKRLKDKVEADKGMTVSKIVKNAEPDTGESVASNSPLIPVFKIKQEPEDLIESDEHTDNSTNVQENTRKLDETDDPQLPALMKQWNVVLKEELVELRQKEKTERLKNEILLHETLRINQKIEKLKYEIETMNNHKKELHKQNSRLKRDLCDKKRDNKQLELEKEAFEEVLTKLHSTNKAIMAENESMKLSKRDFDQQYKKFTDTKDKNNNLKHENNILQQDMTSFKKNNQDMFNVISELRKHNKALGEKLIAYRNGEIEDTTSLKQEKELLQMQVKELKNQYQTIIAENECMLEEIKEFITSNKGMHKIIAVLENHNSATNCKLKDLEEKNQSMSQKILDLESEINDLTKGQSTKVSIVLSKLNQLGNVKNCEPDII